MSGAGRISVGQLAGARDAVGSGGTGVHVAVVGLFLLAVLHAIAVARPVLLPLLIALLLTTVLAPPVARLHRIGVPRQAAAALVVAGLLAVLVAGFASLREPASDWLQRAPSTLEQIERKLSAFKHSVEDVRQTARKVGDVASVGDEPQAASGVELHVRPDPAQRLLSALPGIGLGAASTVVLLYFLLAGGDQFFRALVWCVPAFADKRRAVRIARTAETELARYLATVTHHNLMLGGATAVAMLLLGMPNPMLWGVLAGLLNFVPYLGPLTSVSVIALAALASFEAIGDALMPPAAFVVLTLVEGQILAPILIGARFTIRPLVVVLATLVGGWAWGIGGTLIAVPVLMAVRIACDHVDAMRPLSWVLGPRAASVPAHSARAWRWVHP